MYLYICCVYNIYSIYIYMHICIYICTYICIYISVCKLIIKLLINTKVYTKKKKNKNKMLLLKKLTNKQTRKHSRYQNITISKQKKNRPFSYSKTPPILMKCDFLFFIIPERKKKNFCKNFVHQISCGFG